MNRDLELAQSAAEEGCLTSTVMVGLGLLVPALLIAVRTTRPRRSR